MLPQSIVFSSYEVHSRSFETFQAKTLILKNYKTLIFKVGSSDFSAFVVALQPLYEGLMKVIQSVGVQDLFHSLLHLLNLLELLHQLGAQPKFRESKVWIVGRVRETFDAYQPSPCYHQCIFPSVHHSILQTKFSQILHVFRSS